MLKIIIPNKGSYCCNLRIQTNTYPPRGGLVPPGLLVSPVLRPVLARTPGTESQLLSIPARGRAGNLNPSAPRLPRGWPRGGRTEGCRKRREESAAQTRRLTSWPWFP